MNCPHCQKVLPEKYNATYCPFCGMGIAAAEETAIKQPLLPPIRIRWGVFFGVFLAPALATLVSSLLTRGGHANQFISPYIAFFGGAAAGISCGVMLAMYIGKTVAARLGFGLLFSCFFVVVCITLNFFGCLVGGYQF